jgi:DNA polymerase-1
MIQQMQQLPTMKTQLLFDLESTGLLRQGSRIHCIVMRDATDSSTHVFDHQPDRALIQGVKQLEQADALIGHNIIGYDIPLLKEQFEEFTPKGQLIDTLVLSRLFYPHISDRDFERRPLGMPQRLYGRHSLEAWGYRLKCFKGDYSKAHGNDWSTYSPEMLDYCIQDTEVTLKLYQLMQRRMQDYA